jgi:hypothetical protein
MFSMPMLRRAGPRAMLAAGVGLIGASAHGLVSLDGELSAAATKSAPPSHAAPVADRHRDCPWKDREPAKAPPKDVSF